MAKNIISFSLWGNEPMYTIGAIRNAELAETVYPDWICRFYIGDDVAEDIVDKLKSFDNTEVIVMKDEENDWQGTLWRFNAITSNDDADYVIFRDTDSRLSDREFEAVLEWKNSGKYFHIMRDHPYHTEAILAGMWGCKPKELIEKINEKIYTEESGLSPVSDLERVIDDWFHHEKKNIEYRRHNHLKPEQLTTKGIDQTFLRTLVYPMVFADAYIHDSYPEYNCFSGRFDYQYNPKGKEMNTGFPSRRGTNLKDNWNNFVGQVYDENDIPVEEYAKLLNQRDDCIYMDWNKA